MFWVCVCGGTCVCVCVCVCELFKAQEGEKLAAFTEKSKGHTPSASVVALYSWPSLFTTIASPLDAYPHSVVSVSWRSDDGGWNGEDVEEGEVRRRLCKTHTEKTALWGKQVLGPDGNWRTRCSIMLLW